jgi:putative serine protease PepD
VSDTEPAGQTTPDGSDGPRQRPLSRGVLVAGIAVAALVGGVVGGVVVKATDGDSTSSSSASTTPAASSQPAMCQASAVADKALPSVVTIAANNGRSGGTGSGEIIQEGGYILTNNHVIAVAADGGTISVLYSDGKSSAATLVGRDPLTDLAVIKAADGAAGLPLIPLGDSATLLVGQPVVALGAPLGLSSTVTSGIVSALDRYLPVPGDNGETAHLVGAIQTDAAINPGNSGGALVNCSGVLVGVNSAIATVPNAAGQAGGGSVGLGFAIPVNLAKPISDEIIATGTVTHYTVGMQVQAMPPSVAEKAGLPRGLYVESVTPGGPAASAGIKEGDVVTEVNGEAAVSAEQLTVAEIQAKAGQTISVTYSSAGQTMTATLTPVLVS